MNLVLFSASKIGLRIIKYIKKYIPEISVSGVVTTNQRFKISYRPDGIVDNSLFADFTTYCNKNFIPVYRLESEFKNEITNIKKALNDFKPEIILAAGWYYLIPGEILSIPAKGTIGLHASLLPKYRGGAPLVWSIINGEREAGISLFYLTLSVDTGDIIGAEKIKISKCDDIKSVYDRIEKKSLLLLRKYLPQLKKNTAPRIKQKSIPDNHPEFWPQRSPEDGKIDWSLPAEKIYDFVRAQTKPYPGAFSFYNGHKIKIWKCEMKRNTSFQSADCAEIIKIKNKRIWVGCGSNNLIIVIKDFEIENQSKIDFDIFFKLNSFFY